MVLQAKKLVEDLINSSSLVQLPGTARVQIVDTLMTMLAQELVWKSLSPEGAAWLLRLYSSIHESPVRKTCTHSRDKH